MEYEGLTTNHGLVIESTSRSFVPIDATTAFERNNVVLDAEPKTPRQVHASKPDVERRCAMLLHTGQTLTRTASIGISPDSMKKVQSWKGLLGTILVDCSMFHNANDYRQFVANSPFKGNLQYAINCTCGHHVTVEKASTDEPILDPIGAALAAGNPETERRPFCKKLGLPVLANLAQYNENDAINAVTRLVEAGVIDTRLAKATMQRFAGAEKPIMYVRQLFRLMAARLEEAKSASDRPGPVVGEALKPSELVLRFTTPKSDANVSSVLERPINLEAQATYDSLQVVPRKDAADNIQLSGVQQPVDVDPRPLKPGDIAAAVLPEPVGAVVTRRVGVTIKTLAKQVTSIDVDGTAVADEKDFVNQPLEIVLDAGVPGALDVDGSERANSIS